jgi:hypothetical protein
MYSDCVACQAELPHSSHAEPLSIDGIVVFNEFTGYVWILCRHCAFWNLVPVEERWETLAAIFRLLDAHRKVVVPADTALALQHEGLTIIGVNVKEPRGGGAAMPYAGLRRLRNRVWGWQSFRIALLICIASIAVAVPHAALVILAVSLVALLLAPNIGAVLGRRAVITIADPDSSKEAVREGDLRSANLCIDKDGTLRLCVAVGGENRKLTGLTALRLAAIALRKLNRTALSDNYHEGRALLERHRSNPERLLRIDWPSEYAPDPARVTIGPPEPRPRGASVPRALSDYPAHVRLALEMLVQEQLAARHLRGSIAEARILCSAWVEVAQIADDLLLPPNVSEQLRVLAAGAERKIEP